MWGPIRSLGHPDRITEASVAFRPAPRLVFFIILYIIKKENTPSRLFRVRQFAWARISRKIPLSPFRDPAALGPRLPPPQPYPRRSPALFLARRRRGACWPGSAPTRSGFHLPVADLLRGGGEEAEDEPERGLYVTEGITGDCDRVEKELRPAAGLTTASFRSIFTSSPILRPAPTRPPEEAVNRGGRASVQLHHI